MHKVRIAIIDSNTLSAMGLQRLLESIIPIAEITPFSSYEELVINHPECFVHFFVASGIYFEHAQFFIAQPHRSIVLVHGNAYPHINRLLTLNVCQDEKSIVKDLLQLQRMGHNNGNKAMMAMQTDAAILSSREMEVAILLAKGFINKEIAEKLSISQTTVITHRKNIMEKLKARSLADVIIHVVMNGLIEVDEL